MENSEFGNGLIAGWIGGMLVFIGLFLILSKSPKEFKSSTKIVPEKVLTTDGKKVDTIYVYKLKQE